jgi:hypothetical protein
MADLAVLALAAALVVSTFTNAVLTWRAKRPYLHRCS